MKLREIIETDEWKVLRNRLFLLWRHYTEAAVSAKTFVEKEAYAAKRELIMDILKLPVDEHEGEDLDGYFRSLERQQEKIERASFNV